MKSYVDSGCFHSSIDLFQQMRRASVEPDSFTFPIVNRAVSLLGDQFKLGEMIHSSAIHKGFGEDLYFCNTLIEMYTKNGAINSAYKVFDEMPDRDLVSWTSMISGYVWSGNVRSSYRVFQEMRMDSLEPNLVTLLIMFGACSVDKNVVQGNTLHGYVIKKGFEGDGSLQNSILTMYCKSGSFQNCDILFGSILRRDTVSWNIMISAYSLRGDSSRVADIFDEMRTETIPSLETLTLVISSFAKSGYLLKGKKVHGYVLKTGVFDVVLKTSLVDFYAKCEDVESSFQLFEEVPCRNHITWSAMMSGFVQNGCFKEAIELFCKMQIADLKPGIGILRNLVHSYTHLGAVQLGKVVHGIIIRNMFYCSEENNAVVQTSIMNMYAKCGSIVSARRCFSQIANKDVVAWSSLIEGYSSHGLGFEAIELFNQMMDEGIEPNSVTILSLLSACSHSGLMNEGFKVFDLMSKRFGIEPDINHYTCMVDLLGRSGKLQEAREMIENMVCKADSRIWGSLLAACRVHFENKLGAYAAERVLEFGNPDYNTLLSNVHASSQRWVEADSVREKILRKPPGWSCIEITGRLHGFVAMDASHPQVGEIYELLGSLNQIAVDKFG
ncbi:hypothetical protein ACHQM5_030534 [Ranunculus cassubicifolius]